MTLVKPPCTCPPGSAPTRPVVVVVHSNVKQSESTASLYVYIYICITSRVSQTCTSHHYAASMVSGVFLWNTSFVV